MGRDLDRRLLLAGWLCAGLLVCCAAVTGYGVRRLRQDAAAIARGHEVRAALGGLGAAVEAIESGQQAYALTGEPRYLERRRVALAALDREAERLRLLTADRPWQQECLTRWRVVVTRRFDALDGVSAPKKGDPARQLALVERWKRAAGESRELLEALDQAEADARAGRAASAGRGYALAVAGGLGSLLVGLAAAAAVLWLRRRRQADRAVAAAAEHGQRALLGATLANVADGVIVADPEGSVTHLNPTAHILTGWTEEEARGKPLTVVCPLRDEAQAQAVDNAAVWALRWGRVVQGGERRLLIARDGHTTLVEEAGVPVRRADGQVSGAVLVFRPVSVPSDAFMASRGS